MNTILLIVGALIILLTIYDLVYTTLMPDGAGIITRLISENIYRVFLLLSGEKGSDSILRYSGTFTLISVIFGWIILLWTGNSLMIISDADSVVHTATGKEADFIDKIYFSGYVMSTMGNGDFRPNTGFWQVFSAFMSASGLMIITISITYMIPVLQAEIHKQTLSNYISALRTNPPTILRNGWDGENFKSLENHFIRISDQIMIHSRNHLAFPILHYYHNTIRKHSAALNIASLDEALSLLIFHIPEKYRPEQYSIEMLRNAITSYLETLHQAFIKPTDAKPPELKDYLKNMDALPVNAKSLAEGRESLQINKRRRTLLALVRKSGWNWNDLRTENSPGFLRVQE